MYEIDRQSSLGRKFLWKFDAVPKQTEKSSLAAELHGDPSHPLAQIYAHILLQRGVYSKEEQKTYMQPVFSQLHDPFLMKGMNLSVDLLDKALHQGKRIRLYGDYDVDGTSAVSIMYSILSQLTDHIDYYIPDRYSEGYGLSRIGIEKAINDKIDLLITLDCGIKGIDMIDLAVNNGIRVIVCDHHEPSKILPPADAILNPKQKDCPYPCKFLCGAGVGFKLLQGLFQRRGYKVNALEKCLDVLAIAIAADIVPVLGENRILLKLGLDRIQSDRSVGVGALLEVAGFKEKIEGGSALSVSDLVFGFAPRINAAGRMEHASKAVALLIEQDYEKALEKAHYLNGLNTARRKEEKDICLEAESIASAMDPKRFSTVVYQDHWHKGIVGIVASRIQEKHYLPTIVLTRSKDGFTGSARSVENFNLLDALDACSDLLDRYGGHAFAAGLSLKKENLDVFAERFEEVVKKNNKGEPFQPTISISYALDFERHGLEQGMISKLVRFLELLQPFGPGNWQPIFLTEGLVADPNIIRQVEKNGRRHVFFLAHQPNMSFSIPATAFDFGEWFEELKGGAMFNACYYLEKDFFMQKHQLRMRIKDMELA